MGVELSVLGLLLLLLLPLLLLRLEGLVLDELFVNGKVGHLKLLELELKLSLLHGVELGLWARYLLLVLMELLVLLLLLQMLLILLILQHLLVLQLLQLLLVLLLILIVGTRLVASHASGAKSSKEGGSVVVHRGAVSTE